MSDFNEENILKQFEQEIRSLSLSDFSKTDSCNILFETSTNIDDDGEDECGALETAANQFFEHFNIEKTDVKNPCHISLPFSEFRKDLKEIIKGVYKKVLKAGSGDVIDLEHSIVTYEFAMFLEGSVSPFDSSFINNRPEVTNAGVGILPGIFHALSTMKQGEEADFWIHSNLMFGLKGCAPRVPPSADIVLHVRTKAVKKIQLEIEIEDPKDGEKKTPFMKMLKTAMKDYEKARVNFKNGNYRSCLDLYRVWIKRIEMARLANEHDENKQKRFLAKMYQNAAICYVKVNRPEKACLMIRDLEKLESIRDNAKALYAKGKAKMMLLDYVLARKYFIMADLASPDSQSVAEALMELDTRETEKNKFELEAEQLKQQAESQIKRRDSKLLEKLDRKSQEQRSLEADVLNFKRELTKLVEGFKNQADIRFLSLTTATPIQTPRHLKAAESICKEHGIHLKGYQDDIGSRVHYYLSK